MGDIPHRVYLHDNQQEALGKLQDGNILWGAVGSGKSRVALAYYMLTEEHQDLYIITTAKKRDSLEWKLEAYPFGITPEPELTMAGVLTVDSWNNIAKYAEVKNQFFIFDEQRLVGSGSWVKAFLKIARNNRWIMLSATPGDTWMDYVPVFIANGFYRNRTEFKREHVIQAPFVNYFKVERYVGISRLARLRDKILVRMPYSGETTRHPVNLWCEYDEQAMTRVRDNRWNVFEDRPIREIAEMFHLMRKVTNSHPSRLEAVKRLLTEHPRLIVFYNFDYELEALRTLQDGAFGADKTAFVQHATLRAGEHRITEKLDFDRSLGDDLYYAEWNGHKHEPIPKSWRWVYIVQYAAGAEGWNCTTTNAECFYSLPYSYKLWEQAHGRIDRMNTPYRDLYYYSLRSKASIDWAIYRALLTKKSFQTQDFGVSDSDYYAKLRKS